MKRGIGKNQKKTKLMKWLQTDKSEMENGKKKEGNDDNSLKEKYIGLFFFPFLVVVFVLLRVFFFFPTEMETSKGDDAWKV